MNFLLLLTSLCMMIEANTILHTTLYLYKIKKELNTNLQDASTETCRIHRQSFIVEKIISNVGKVRK